jgi:hypothetical protein
MNPYWKHSTTIVFDIKLKANKHHGIDYFCEECPVSDRSVDSGLQVWGVVERVNVIFCR